MHAPTSRCDSSIIVYCCSLMVMVLCLPTYCSEKGICKAHRTNHAIRYILDTCNVQAYVHKKYSDAPAPCLHACRHACMRTCTCIHSHMYAFFSQGLLDCIPQALNPKQVECPCSALETAGGPHLGQLLRCPDCGLWRDRRLGPESSIATRRTQNSPSPST